MKCPECGKEHDIGKCPEASRTKVGSKSLGICPECSSEQTGTVYRIPTVVADFLKPKYADVFVPDKHRCVRKVAAG